jgi:hypothetical protein
MRTRLLIAGPLATVASLLFAASAMAGVRLTVTTPLDNSAGPTNSDGLCTLREAVEASNTGTGTATDDCPSSGTPSENQIGFDPALGANPVINLTAFGSLQFGTNDVTVTGPATVNGFTGSRVITSNNINLTLNSLTISNGSENTQGQGGGIRQINGRLFLNSSTVSGNTTTQTSTSSVSVTGGGIWSSGPVTLTDSVVADNQAVANYTGASTGSSIALGGGVEVNSEDLTVENSVASGNQAIATGNGSGAVEADGGGLRTDGNVLVEHSTISGNSTSATQTGSGVATVQGAGMLFHNPSGTIDVELSTIANNLMKATGNAAITQRGGGIENFDASTANYISDTIAGNGIDPTSSAAGIEGLNFQSASAGTRAFSNTIIANPVGSVGTNCFGDEPYATGGDPNLEFPATGTSPTDCFAAAPGILTVDPQLGALGNNGGTTQTMLPALTSPVIDKGTANAQNDLTEDQRGLTRPVVFSGLTHPFDGSDIGAVETQLACAGQSTPSTTCAGPPSPPSPTGQRAAALKKCKKLKGKAKAKKRRKCIKRAKKLPV